MRMATKLPSAIGNFTEILKKIKHRQLVLFFDFDGTLSPIVSQPEEASLSDSMIQKLNELSSHYFIAIISGRSLDDVQNRVGIKGIFYAGSHGFEIRDSEGNKKEFPETQAYLPVMEKCASDLKKVLNSFEGCKIETKPFSLAIHYRNVLEEKKENLKTIVEKLFQNYPKLKLQHGKQVINISPNLEWDKGKALLWILEQHPFENHFPVYVGDDVTDEDAFKVLKEKGIGILVRDEDRETYADFALSDTKEVEKFIQKLIEVKTHV